MVQLSGQEINVENSMHILSSFNHRLWVNIHCSVGDPYLNQDVEKL